MSDILLDEQGFPATPGAGQGIIYYDTSASILINRDKNGGFHGRIAKAAIASQGAGFATDTYVTNSGLLLPSYSMQAQMVFKWVLSFSKTAASTATPIYQIRIGANQSTADTSRLSLTGPAQTAAVDVGLLTILVTVRTVAVNGVIQGTAVWNHTLGTATGFGGNVEGTSAGFDNTALQGQYIGLSINGGASAAWTLTQCIGEVFF